MSPIYEEGSGRSYDLNGLVGEPVRVDGEVLRQLTNENDFSALAFELYKETGEVVACAPTRSLATAQAKACWAGIKQSVRPFWFGLSST